MKGSLHHHGLSFPELPLFLLDFAFTCYSLFSSPVTNLRGKRSRCRGFQRSVRRLIAVNRIICAQCLHVLANTYFMAIIATVGGMLFGFDISSMSAIVITDQYIDYFNNPSGLTQGAIGSALAAGSVVGSLMAGPISDKYGRRDR